MTDATMISISIFKWNASSISIRHCAKHERKRTLSLFSLHYTAAKQALPSNNPPERKNHFGNMLLDPRRLIGVLHEEAQGDFKVQPCSTKVVSVCVFVNSPRTPQPSVDSSLRSTLISAVCPITSLFYGCNINNRSVNLFVHFWKFSLSWWLSLICACFLHSNEGENKPLFYSNALLD